MIAKTVHRNLETTLFHGHLLTYRPFSIESIYTRVALIFLDVTHLWLSSADFTLKYLAKAILKKCNIKLLILFQSAIMLYNTISCILTRDRNLLSHV